MIEVISWLLRFNDSAMSTRTTVGVRPGDTAIPGRPVSRTETKITSEFQGWLVGWLVFNDSTRNKNDTTVGVGHSRRYCNTGYDQSQGRRPQGPVSRTEKVHWLNLPREI